MMTQRGPVAAEDRRQQEKDTGQRLAALRHRLHETAREIRTAGDWARCLHAAARLTGEEWPNVPLITSQKPDATLVMGYEAWRANGRQVNRGEKGIEIFSHSRQAPGNRRAQDVGEQDHSRQEARRVAYVWDLSQTSGKPMPAPSAEVHSGLWDSLCWLARREGFAVDRDNDSPQDGTILWATRRIQIPFTRSTAQDTWALAHQLGHVLLRHTSVASPAGCQGVLKAEADSVAFIFCVRYGIPIKHTFSSPQTWAGTDPRAQPAATILAVGERITTAAATISHFLESQVTPIDTAATKPSSKIASVLTAAGQFYSGQLASSWVPAYLRKRGLTHATINEWRIGYAPAGGPP